MSILTSSIIALPLRGKYGYGKTTIISLQDYSFISKFPWYLRNDGYVVYGDYSSGKLKNIRLNRMIMNAKKGQIVDHINRNPLDNRRENLRFVDPNLSTYNRKNIINISGFRGVTFNPNGNFKKWYSRIKKNNKSEFLGCFNSKEKAALSYNKAAIRLYGNNAILNII